MSDLISRQAAIEVAKYKPDIAGALAELPSVQQEPKIGHWITDAKTYYEELNKRGLGVDEYTPYFTDDIACSECLAKYSVIDNETQFFKHCPNCGAKMIELQESEKINCKTTKCENCINHNYCDFEPQESEDKE